MHLSPEHRARVALAEQCSTRREQPPRVLVLTGPIDRIKRKCCSVSRHSGDKLRAALAVVTPADSHRSRPVRVRLVLGRGCWQDAEGRKDRGNGRRRLGLWLYFPVVTCPPVFVASRSRWMQPTLHLFRQPPQKGGYCRADYMHPPVDCSKQKVTQPLPIQS